MCFITVQNIDYSYKSRDVGLIPLGMQRYKNYSSGILTYKNFDDEVSDIDLFYVKPITGDFNVDVCFYLLKHSKEIDILNCYHLTMHTAVHVFIFKWMNPKGKVYLKMDACISKEEACYQTHRFSALRKALFTGLMEKCTLVSTEMEGNAKRLTNSWGRTIEHITNPISPDEFSPTVCIPLVQRVKRIVTIGKIGSTPKATDVLLMAYAKIHSHLPEWQLCLIGPVDYSTGFNDFWSDYSLKYPDVTKDIVFYGKISDRNQLQGILQNSRVFVFPSRSEGYALSAIEALASGTIFVGSDIPSNRDVTDNWAFGYKAIVDDSDSLAQALLDACNESDLSESQEMSNAARKSVLLEHNLQNICERIYEFLEE